MIQQRRDDATIRTLLQEKATKDAVNPIEMLTDEEFVQRFRLRKETVKDLIDLLKPDLMDKKGVVKKDSLPLHNQVLAALRFYATGDVESKIDDKINIGGPTMLHYVEKVSYAMELKQAQFINFAMTKQAIQQASEKFASIANFPRICGIVDAFHVRLDKFKENTGENPAPYVNTAGIYLIFIYNILVRNSIILF